MSGVLSDADRRWVNITSRMRVCRSGCIVLHGRRPIGQKGYYAVHVCGTRMRAHRAVWERVVGPIPAGMMIDHVCRNRACVNPRHLRVVTARQNTLENSASMPALHAKKTHCPRGHAYTGNNLRVRLSRGRPMRQCVLCVRALGRVTNAAYRARIRAALAQCDTQEGV